MEKAPNTASMLKILRSIKCPEDRESFRKFCLKRLRAHRRRQLNNILSKVNPGGLQYRPTPDDLIVMERRKRSRERMESGYWGEMGNN